MSQLEKLFPSKIAKALGFNHSRYIAKLYKPEGFSFKDIKRLALLIDVNPRIISNIILDEIERLDRTNMKPQKRQMPKR